MSAPPASVGDARMRHHPAVPSTSPTKLQVPDFVTALPDDSLKVSPLTAATPLAIVAAPTVAVSVVTVVANATPLCAAPVPAGALTVTTVPDTVAVYKPFRLIAAHSAAAVVAASTVKATAPRGMMLSVPTVTVLIDPAEPATVIVCEARVSGVQANDDWVIVPSRVPVAAESADVG